MTKVYQEFEEVEDHQKVLDEMVLIYGKWDN
jgi:hypothetical protein